MRNKQLACSTRGNRYGSPNFLSESFGASGDPITSAGYAIIRFPTSAFQYNCKREKCKSFH